MKKILMMNFFTLIWILPSLSQIITTDIQYNRKGQTLELTVVNPTDYYLLIVNPMHSESSKTIMWVTAVDDRGKEIYRYHHVPIAEKNGKAYLVHPIAPHSSVKTKHSIKKILGDKFDNAALLYIDWRLRYILDDPVLREEKKNINYLIIEREFELLKD